MLRGTWKSMPSVARFVLGLAILGCCCGTSASAASLLWNTPVYNPESKSYFELFTPSKQLTEIEHGLGVYGLSWGVAKGLAEKQTFKGVRGRLAVVDTRQIHEFLKEKFHPTIAVWIGLRYWCKFKKLQWVTGKVFDRQKDFAAWGGMWNQNGIHNYYRLGQTAAADDCSPIFAGRLNYLGVHYWPMSEGFLWNANGYSKHFAALFIEFPTGKP
jgi:hypothetical protein